MGKIIRLTESQLTELVKKVISEQSREKLLKPISIKIEVPQKNAEDVVYLVTFDSIIKGKDGCQFIGKFRGVNKEEKFEYLCTEELFWIPSSLTKIRHRVKTSPEAGKLLANACACGAYASNQKAGGGQANMA